METNKKTNLFKSKLFIASLVLYILIPIIFVIVINIDVPIRTAGTYVYFENNQEVARIVLKKDNTVSMSFIDEEHKDDKEYRYRAVVTNWVVRYSDWYKKFDTEQYPYLSNEYVMFCNEKLKSHFILFKKGNYLFSDYLLDEDRGGGQKCYKKL